MNYTIRKRGEGSREEGSGEMGKGRRGGEEPLINSLKRRGYLHTRWRGIMRNLVCMCMCGDCLWSEKNK